MLPKASRLFKKQDFKEVAKRGRAIHSTFLVFKKIPAGRPVPTLIGLVVSGKVSKKSTVRNKIRRRLREILREQLGQIKPGYKVILVVKATILDKDFMAIKNDLKFLFKRADLL